ncbi:nitroreductase family deazaflavin-dependent oxidoreductase [Sinosporangium siamense]|uniref:DUF385 domain-containing protein n=1 Tax=Sinosporangium siamense TaxID=1367973 RepID=A0A919V8Z7_9ACTN|nr:nitroreductase family deazaflavin-dependent oxidoreductase [Sinosporangium siamense]GII93767.1 hypothetical protein Ssi02_39980 [Sinosporangium siamense]
MEAEHGENEVRPRRSAWSANLLAAPDAVIAVRGRPLRVAARLLTGDERGRAFDRVLGVWPPYEHYAAVSGREPRVFRLEPRE